MLKLITPAASYPVTLAQIKEHLAIDGTSHDDRLTALIPVAVNYCERELNRAIAEQTWELHLPCFPAGCITLPLPPVTAVVHIKYYDTDNTLQTLDTADYRVILPYEQPAWVEPVESWPYAVWPHTHHRSDAVQVRFTAGYSTCPDPIKHAIKLLVGTWNENREGENTAMTKQLEQGVADLLGKCAWGVYA